MIFGPHHTIRPVGVSRRYRKQPHAAVGAKDLGEVLVGTYVVYIWPCVGISLPFEVVQSWGVAEDQFNVKLEKHGDDNKEGNLDNDSDDSDNEVDGEALGFIGNGYNLLYEEGDLAAEGVNEGQDDIEEEEHEEFSVTEAHAIGDPGAVVVHI